MDLIKCSACGHDFSNASACPLCGCSVEPNEAAKLQNTTNDALPQKAENSPSTNCDLNAATKPEAFEKRQEWQGRARNYLRRGSAAPLCGMAPPFRSDFDFSFRGCASRRRSNIRSARLPGRRSLKYLESAWRKGGTFPHSGAAQPRTARSNGAVERQRRPRSPLKYSRTARRNASTARRFDGNFGDTIVFQRAASGPTELS